MCKHIKKIRSSQPAIPVPNWVKHQSFPVRVVKELDPTKAHGHYNISIRMIKLCIFSISKPLHIPFNVPLNVKGMFPQLIEEGKYCSCLLQLINNYWSVLTYPKLLTENWHEDLMYKCRKCYGLILFLSDRFQRVTLNRKPSNWFHIKAFLPQGSIRQLLNCLQMILRFLLLYMTLNNITISKWRLVKNKSMSLSMEHVV